MKVNNTLHNLDIPTYRSNFIFIFFSQAKTSDYDCGAKYFHYTCYFDLILSEKEFNLSTMEADFLVETSNGIPLMENIDLIGLAIHCNNLLPESCVSVWKTKAEPKPSQSPGLK